MQSVLARLGARAKSFSEHPFFAFLKDETIPGRDRMAFAPCIAPHVLTFRDLCAHVVRDDAGEAHPVQALVNVHSREDDDHWQWFLDDLARLGDDPTLSFTAATRFLWSDATLQTRLLGYRLCAYAMGAAPIDRLLVLQCVEAAFQVALGSVGGAVRAFTASGGPELSYFGAAHEAAEAAHTGEDESHRVLAETHLDEAQRVRLLALVDGIFDAYEAWARELLAFSTQRREHGGAVAGFPAAAAVNAHSPG